MKITSTKQIQFLTYSQTTHDTKADVCVDTIAYGLNGSNPLLSLS